MRNRSRPSITVTGAAVATVLAAIAFVVGPWSSAQADDQVPTPGMTISGGPVSLVGNDLPDGTHVDCTKSANADSFAHLTGDLTVTVVTNPAFNGDGVSLDFGPHYPQTILSLTGGKAVFQISHQGPFRCSDLQLGPSPSIHVVVAVFHGNAVDQLLFGDYRFASPD